MADDAELINGPVNGIGDMPQRTSEMIKIESLKIHNEKR